MKWDRIRGPKEACAAVIATGFGAGLSPVAPGTAGTLVGVPIVWLTADLPVPFRLALWLFLFLAGVWAAKEFDDNMESHDNQNIVMDEVVGYGITAWTAGTDIQTLLAAFFVFRVLDILKVPPVRQIDQWSKRGSAWMGGFGVMADDALAGFQGLLIMILLQYYKILS